MTQLRVKSQLPLGIAWLWVKTSFTIFREKPVNFLVFVFFYGFFSILPFIGAFLAPLVLVRIYLSSRFVETNQHFDLRLHLGWILRQRNLVTYALLNMLVDLLLMSLLGEFLRRLGVDMSSPMTIVLNQQALSLLIVISVLRAMFFGISLPILSFNVETPVLLALKLSWQFILKNITVVVLSLILLLPFLLVPLYLALNIVTTVNNLFVFGLSGLVVIIVGLLYVGITNIYCYLLCRDGIIHE